MTVTTPTPPAATTSFTYDPLVRPEVDAVSPNSGPANQPTQAWITGKGLGGATAVTVGGQSATFFPQFGTDDVLQVNVPPYSGPPAATPIVEDVVVTSGAAGSSAISSNDHFSYTAAVAQPLPTVSAVSPSAGPTSGGTTVYISRTRLHQRPASASARPPSRTAAGQVLGDTLIQATSPGASASTVDVVVTNPTGPSAQTTNDHFTYTATPPTPPTGPYVNALNPNQGSTTGGDSPTIIGGHFTGATGVAFGNGQPIGPCGPGPGSCFFVNDDNHIGVYNSPPGTGTVDVTVIGPGGTSPASNADLYSFVPPGLPTVDAVAPNQGPTFGGAQGQIYGSNLSSVDSVKFGGASLPPCPPPGPGGCFSSGGNNTIFVSGVPPATQAGTVDVTVHNVTGNSTVTAADKYTYYNQPAPIVTAVNPNHGPSVGGTQVYVSGQHMLGASQVSFGGTPVSLFGGSGSDNLVIVTSPPGTASTTPVDVTVGNPTGTSAISSADHFTLTAPRHRR